MGTRRTAFPCGTAALVATATFLIADALIIGVLDGTNYLLDAPANATALTTGGGYSPLLTVLLS